MELNKIKVLTIILIILSLTQAVISAGANDPFEFELNNENGGGEHGTNLDIFKYSIYPHLNSMPVGQSLKLIWRNPKNPDIHDSMYNIVKDWKNKSESVDFQMKIPSKETTPFIGRIPCQLKINETYYTIDGPDISAFAINHVIGPYENGSTKYYTKIIMDKDETICLFCPRDGQQKLTGHGQNISANVTTTLDWLVPKDVADPARCEPRAMRPL